MYLFVYGEPSLSLLWLKRRRSLHKRSVLPQRTAEKADLYIFRVQLCICDCQNRRGCCSEYSVSCSCRKKMENALHSFKIRPPPPSQTRNVHRNMSIH